MAVFQCCYTNATTTVGGVARSGWQPVAVSDAIPPEALNRCISLQTVNSAIQGATLDENGDALNLLEIVGDQDYVYVLRSQYGLLDRIGRANMFSHAYIMPWDDEALTDPNTFLSIADANFADNEESASQSEGKLIRYEPWTIESACAAGGLCEETYLTLMRCVVARLLGKEFLDPLYVQYDGTPEQFRALVYCIYKELPLYLRKRLSIASAPGTNTGNRTLVFSMRAREKQLYVNPATGENSILSDRIVRKIARFEYLDYAPKRVGSCNPDDYYSKLESTAIELGDSTASYPDLLKVSHRLITGFDYSNLDDATLKEEIADAFLSISGHSEKMETLLASLLNLACQRQIALPEMTEKEVNRQLSAATTDELKNAGERYLIYRFSEVPEEKAVQGLCEMDAAALPTYIKWLQETPRGLAVLDAYYAAKVANAKPLTWEVLGEIAQESAYLSSREKTVEAIDTWASQLYASKLKNLSAACDNYDSYIELMKLILPEGDIAFCERGAKERYWEHVTLNTFDAEQFDTYLRMSDESPKAKAVIKMARIVKLLDVPEEEKFLYHAQLFVRDCPSELGSREVALHAFFREVKQCYGEKGDDLSWWLRILCDESSDDAARCLIFIRKALIEDNVLEFFKLLEALLNMRLPNQVGTKIDADVVKQALPKLEGWDWMHPCSLDNWLLVGDAYGRNPYEIFDMTNPKIVDMDPALAVSGSILLVDLQDAELEVAEKARRYIYEAEAYVRGHGTAKKTVKRWLQEVKKNSKANRVPAGNSGGFFSKNAPRVENDAQRNSAQHLAPKHGLFFRKRKGGDE